MRATRKRTQAQMPMKPDVRDGNRVAQAERTALPRALSERGA